MLTLAPGPCGLGNLLCNTPKRCWKVAAAARASRGCPADTPKPKVTAVFKATGKGTYGRARGQDLPYVRTAATAATAWPESHDKARVPQDVTTEDYELIIVGSGNGACAFLTKYLDATTKDHHQPARRVLVIEEGTDFLSTSAITHQANWTRGYAEASVYKLHDATTGDKAGNRPIITGRACTQGGGGSINYSMMHESSEWLAHNLGAGHPEFGPGYWDELKAELGQLFDRLPPAANRTPVATAMHGALTQPTDSPNGPFFFDDVADNEATAWIPEYIDGPAPAMGRLYSFNSQFDDFGQRTHSGVSLVGRGASWRRNKRIDLWTNARVEGLAFDPVAAAAGSDRPQLACSGLTVRHLVGPDAASGPAQLIFDPTRTSVVLAAGSSTPRLLLPHKQALQNPDIGLHVNDHIVLPVGFYSLKQTKGKPEVSPKDQYLPLFAAREVDVHLLPPASSSSSTGSDGSQPEDTTLVVSYDFFAGPLSDLSYFLAHLFVSLWLPNWAKTLALEVPAVFQWLKQITAWTIQGFQLGANVWYGLLSFGKPVPPINVITGILKFNIAYDGYYKEQHYKGLSGGAGTRIVLNCFASSPAGERNTDATETPDGVAARAALPPLMRKLDVVGNRPPGVVQWLMKLLTSIPFDPESTEEIDAYIRRYADSNLLTEQHMAGGCLLGKAAEVGSSNPRQCGSVKGSSNVIVADLSASPLPRVSPQMTAYLMGYHVAKQRFSGSVGATITSAPSSLQVGSRSNQLM